jgi:uncharacterized membrane protein YtjA (UPF0391 family)
VGRQTRFYASSRAGRSGMWVAHEAPMIRASIAFFVIGLFALLLGANNVAGLSIDIGKLLLTFFIGLAIVGLLVRVLTSTRSDRID